jgi:hypothetical protein
MASIAAVIDSDVAIPECGAQCCPLLVMTWFKSTYWLLATLNETGKAAVLISHGGLFRRGTEASIRGGMIRDDIGNNTFMKKPVLPN